MKEYKIMFYNENSGYTDEVREGTIKDLNRLEDIIRDYENDDPELLKTGYYFAEVRF